MGEKTGYSTTVPVVSTPNVSAVPKGTLIGGKYTVVRELGAGGMGVVLEARHEALGELVAVKMLRGGGASDPETVARFVREARSARKLKGEHTVRVYDVGTTPEGQPYIVMERLIGTDLADCVKERGPLPATEAVGYVLQACEALAEAHALGIVHRDLKPSNLFVTEAADGTALVKVLDFGIAKAAESGDSTLTETGAVFGSPQYMPPEQIRSAKRADARSDVWSMGVVLYELLSGKTPFEGETAAAVIASIMTDAPPSLTALRPEVPEDLGRAVEACLVKSADARTASVLELAVALAPFGPPGSEGTVARIRRLTSRLSAPPSGSLRPEAPSAGALRNVTTAKTRAQQTTRAPVYGRIALLAVVLGAIGAFAFVKRGGTERAPAATDLALSAAPALAERPSATAPLPVATLPPAQAVAAPPPSASTPPAPAAVPPPASASARAVARPHPVPVARPKTEPVDPLRTEAASGRE